MRPLPSQVLTYAVAAILVFIVLSFILTALPTRTPFISSEVRFTDLSSSGMLIIPASCASSPSSYHGNLAATTDGKGFQSESGQTEYGATVSGVGTVCVTNSSGASYFVPANTAAELQTFKNTAPSIPGLQVY